jgi:hypothetical protein
VPRHAAAGVGAEAAARGARGNASAAEPPHREGSRRRATPRHDDGVAVGRGNARRLMPPAGVAGRRARPRHPITTTRPQGEGVAPHRLARQGEVERPAHVGGGYHSRGDS